MYVFMPWICLQTRVETPFKLIWHLYDSYPGFSNLLREPFLKPYYPAPFDGKINPIVVYM